MALFIENAVIQAAVNAAVNRDLKNMMIRIQEMIFQGQRGSQDP